MVKLSWASAIFNPDMAQLEKYAGLDRKEIGFACNCWVFEEVVDGIVESQPRSKHRIACEFVFNACAHDDRKTEGCYIVLKSILFFTTWTGRNRGPSELIDIVVGVIWIVETNALIAGVNTVTVCYGC